VVPVSDPAGISGGTTTPHDNVTKRITYDWVNGHEYRYNARGWDGIDLGSPTDGCQFWYDDKQPTADKPTSADFRSDGTGTGTVGVQGTFTLSATDPVPSNGGKNSKIDYFTYSFVSESQVAGGSGGTKIQVNPTGSTAAATIHYTPTQWGTQYLYVVAVDNAGNPSAVATDQFYVADTGNYTVHPGDVDGDGHPDLLAIQGGSGGTDGNLNLYPAGPPKGATRLPTPVAASDIANSPDRSGWNGTVIAHRSSEKQSDTGTAVDDLWALKNGFLRHYTNNLYEPGFVAGSTLYYTFANSNSVVAPACGNDPGQTSCPTYYTPTWIDVPARQGSFVAGDFNHDGLPDLMVIRKTGSNGMLWFYPGTTTGGVLAVPYLVGDSNWNTLDLIAPGDSTGDGIPDLWARDNQDPSTGTQELRMFRTIVAPDGTVSLASPVVNTNQYWGPNSRTLVTSPGDTDGDGLPELFTTTPAPGCELWENEELATSATTLQMSAHTVIDDGGGTSPINWDSVSALS
jgi:hypothetical protein